MGSEPKQSDYEATAAERTSAGVALDQYNFFKNNYGPLLIQLRDQSLTEDVSTTLRGRANADTMQTLTSQPSYRSTQSTSNTGDMAQAYQGQLGVADQAALDIKNQQKLNVAGTAQGQAADASTGLAEASRLNTSQALGRADAKATKARAKFAATGKILGALGMQAAKNMQTTGVDYSQDGEMNGDGMGPPAPKVVRGGPFSPVNAQGQKVTGFGERLAFTNFLGMGG